MKSGDAGHAELTGMTSHLMSWAGALPAYLMTLEAAGRSPGTVRLHRHYLTLLRNRHKHPWTVERGDLVKMLAVAGWAPETRKSARTVLRGFYRWGLAEGLIDQNPARDLLPVRVPAGIPRPTPETVVRELLAGADERVVLMGMLAALAGLRRAEIARVHRDALEGDELRVVGKGGKVRMVPILDAELLERLRAVRGYAFPSRDDGHLSPDHVGRLLSRALPGGWTGHTLRHRMATRAYAGTRDLLAVGAVLGHSRPETTQRYVRLPDDALRRAVGAAGLVA